MGLAYTLFKNQCCLVKADGFAQGRLLSVSVRLSEVEAVILSKIKGDGFD